MHGAVTEYQTTNKVHFYCHMYCLSIYCEIEVLMTAFKKLLITDFSAGAM